jgi:hypothetical protein
MRLKNGICPTRRVFPKAGLEICKKFRKEVEEAGPENFEYFIDTLYGLPMHKPKEPKE